MHEIENELDTAKYNLLIIKDGIDAIKRDLSNMRNVLEMFILEFRNVLDEVERRLSENDECDV